MKQSLFALATVLMASIAQAQTESRFPFVMPWDDATKNAADVSFLNPAPLTEKHRITARDGHFFDQSGRRVRFMGTGTSAGANFPKKEDAPKIAARLHKLGFNIIRLHHMDATWANPGIFDGDKTREAVSPDSLDRLDYFVSCLKENGIYVDLNLHVSWAPSKEAGFPDTDKIPELGKQISYFEKRSIEHQKNYARQFLEHINPYTKLKWADDPAVALIEITNEDSLFGDAFSGKFQSLPPYYRDQLQAKWNDFLKAKYASTEAMLRAWVGPQELGPNLLQNVRFEQEAEKWFFEKQSGKYEWKFEEITQPGPQGRTLHLTLQEKPAETWHHQFHQTGLDFEDGATYTVQFWAKAGQNRNLPVYLGFDKEPWHRVGDGGRVALTPQWKKYSVVISATNPLPQHNRLSFGLGEETGDLWLADLSIRKGIVLELEPNQKLEDGTLPLANGANTTQGRDWIDFLLGVERDYSLMMRDYIQKDLGAKAPVTCSQAWLGGLGGVLRESRMDWVDMHAYWQHPHFPNKPWDAGDWTIDNTAMTSEYKGGTIPHLAQHRVEGKPFTVTEYNHPAPNDYASETMPLIAAYAAWQDWDGIFLFDYHGSSSGWDTNRITSYFGSSTDPNKMAAMPAASMLFLGRKVTPQKRQSTLVIPRGAITQAMARNSVSGFWESNLGRLWSQSGATRRDWLNSKMAIRLVDGSGTLRLERRFEGASNQLDWRTDAPESAALTLSGEGSKAVIGFLGGQWIDLGGLIVQMDKTPRNFVTLVLTPRDNKSITQSSSLLLTAMGSIENKDMKWNEKRTSVGTNWGTGPTMAEGIPAQIILNTGATKAEVWALEGTGKRRQQVPSQLKDGKLSFRIGSEYQTVWYEIATSFPVMPQKPKPSVTKTPVPRPVSNKAPTVKTSPSQKQQAKPLPPKLVTPRVR